MMRKKIIAGNWKMNTNADSSLELAKEIVSESASVPSDVTLIAGVPFLFIQQVQYVAQNTNLAIAAQDCAATKNGAYTGEVSAEMLQSAGVPYVILGHSERREYFGESHSIIQSKVNRALEVGLQVIFCCGEVLADRKAGNEFKVVEQQIDESLFDLTPTDFERIVIAYEPVWAIGTGETASPEQAQEMHAFIRKLIATKYGESIANATSILYGGSMKPENAKELLAQSDIDGGLIGGASLNADSFITIAQSY
jgi:triosephosphate isomerase